MQEQIIDIFKEREKREKIRKSMVMPTKDLADYLTFKQSLRETRRGREYWEKYHGYKHNLM